MSWRDDQTPMPLSKAYLTFGIIEFAQAKGHKLVAYNGIDFISKSFWLAHFNDFWHQQTKLDQISQVEGTVLHKTALTSDTGHNNFRSSQATLANDQLATNSEVLTTCSGLIFTMIHRTQEYFWWLPFYYHKSIHVRASQRERCIEWALGRSQMWSFHCSLLCQWHIILPTQLICDNTEYCQPAYPSFSKSRVFIGASLHWHDRLNHWLNHITVFGLSPLPVSQVIISCLVFLVWPAPSWVIS